MIPWPPAGDISAISRRRLHLNENVVDFLPELMQSWGGEQLLHAG